MSGWSQRSVAIIAPRRAPALPIASHIRSAIRISATGPGAVPPVSGRELPSGAASEKS